MTANAAALREIGEPVTPEELAEELGIAEIAAFVNLSESSARAITARPDFPAPIKVLDGRKGRRWKPSEVEEWALRQRAPLRARHK